MSQFFSKQWLEDDFMIPSDRARRAELLRTMKKVFESDEARLPENKVARRALLARISAVQAYDAIPS